MRKPFDRNYPLTQEFNDSCCRDLYAQFNMKGHNGLDYGLPTGTSVLAPHSGKVIERGFDKNGYGNYIKIENTVEGSVLAHLKEFKVNLNDTVSEGQLVGLSDNTGFSTASHLHWGHYRIPRDRSNGFLGYIDPIPFLQIQTPPMANCDEIKAKLEETQKKLDEVIKERDRLNKVIEGKDKTIIERDGQLQTMKKSLDLADKEIMVLIEEKQTMKSNHIAELANQKEECEKKIKEIQSIPPKEIIKEVTVEVEKKPKSKRGRFLYWLAFTFDK